VDRLLGTTALRNRLPPPVSIALTYTPGWPADHVIAPDTISNTPAPSPPGRVSTVAADLKRMNGPRV
jgi:hypothetical protein